MGRYLGVGSNSLNEAFWRHNLQKIEFGKLPPDTNISAPEIRSRVDKWKKYRRFTEQGGCREPFDPEALAAVLFPEKKMEARIVKESLKGGPLPEWSGNWRQGGPATLAAQVSRIVPSRGQGDRPFPAPSPAEPPPSRGTAAAGVQGAAEGSMPAGGTSDAALAEEGECAVPTAEDAAPAAGEGALSPRARAAAGAPLRSQERSWRAGLNSRRSPTHPRHCRRNGRTHSDPPPCSLAEGQLHAVHGLPTPRLSLQARTGPTHLYPSSSHYTGIPVQQRDPGARGFQGFLPHFSLTSTVGGR